MAVLAGTGVTNTRKILLDYYDKEKYREMVIDAAEAALRLFGFDRTVCGNFKKKKGRNGTRG